MSGYKFVKMGKCYCGAEAFSTSARTGRPSEPRCQVHVVADKIVSVALREHDGTLHVLPQPNRHGDVIHKLAKEGVHGIAAMQQGFVTEAGQWLRRVPALEHALKIGQVKGSTHEQLYSEDLW